MADGAYLQAMFSFKVSQDGASLSMFGEDRTSINHRHLVDPSFSHKKISV